jgi:hypothetical protein
MKSLELISPEVTLVVAVSGMDLGLEGVNS